MAITMACPVCSTPLPVPSRSQPSIDTAGKPVLMVTLDSFDVEAHLLTHEH